jgi:hypothetical protein
MNPKFKATLRVMIRVYIHVFAVFVAWTGLYALSRGSLFLAGLLTYALFPLAQLDDMYRDDKEDKPPE